MLVVQQRLYYSHNYLASMNQHSSLTNPGQLQQETFVLLTMLGVTMFALLSIWYTLQSSYRYTNTSSKGGGKEPPQISRRIYSATCLALVIQFWISVHMLPAAGGGGVGQQQSQSQVSFGQNGGSGFHMRRNLTTMGSFRQQQVVPPAQKRHVVVDSTTAGPKETLKVSRSGWTF